MDNGLDYRVTERAREMIAIFLKPLPKFTYCQEKRG